MELKVGANEFETDRQIHLKTLSVFQYMDNLMRTCIALRIKLKNENNFQLTESYLLGAFAITFSDKIKKEDIQRASVYVTSEKKILWDSGDLWNATLV